MAQVRNADGSYGEVGFQADSDGIVATFESIYRLRSAASDNAALIAAGNKRLGAWFFANRSAAQVVVKLYNKATTPSSADTPVISIPIPASGQSALNLGPFGAKFSAGIGIRVVTGIADGDNTAVVADDVHGAVFYS